MKIGISAFFAISALCYVVNCTFEFSAFIPDILSGNAGDLNYLKPYFEPYSNDELCSFYWTYFRVDSPFSNWKRPNRLVPAISMTIVDPLLEGTDNYQFYAMLAMCFTRAMDLPLAQYPTTMGTWADISSVLKLSLVLYAGDVPSWYKNARYIELLHRMWSSSEQPEKIITTIIAGRFLHLDGAQSERLRSFAASFFPMSRANLEHNENALNSVKSVVGDALLRQDAATLSWTISVLASNYRDDDREMFNVIRMLISSVSLAGNSYHPPMLSRKVIIALGSYLLWRNENEGLLPITTIRFYAKTVIPRLIKQYGGQFANELMESLSVDVEKGPLNPYVSDFPAENELLGEPERTTENEEETISNIEALGVNMDFLD